ncbi:MAG: hypothetical protein K8W52_04910 [Deltaproteobacteria bacterium]|nr:hypothetical protein [Deltaproteobacteria bacterium]
MDGGPYRQAPVREACPTCATPLPEAERGQLQACPQGCGEWASALTVSERWADALDRDRSGRILWQQAATALPCIHCGKAMLHAPRAIWGTHRCREHGVWFARNARARFEGESTLAAELAARREAIRGLAITLREALAGDRNAQDALVRRIVDLEREVARAIAWSESARDRG